MKTIRNLVGLAAVACVVSIASPAAAQSRSSSGYSSIDRMSEAGRYGTSRAGRFVGNRMCGRTCGRAMQHGTERVYVGSRNFAVQRGEQLRNWGGRYVAPRIRRR
jgi:hypothetical protein